MAISISAHFCVTRTNITACNCYIYFTKKWSQANKQNMYFMPHEKLKHFQIFESYDFLSFFLCFKRKWWWFILQNIDAVAYKKWSIYAISFNWFIYSSNIEIWIFLKVALMSKLMIISKQTSNCVYVLVMNWQKSYINNSQQLWIWLHSY